MKHRRFSMGLFVTLALALLALLPLSVMAAPTDSHLAAAPPVLASERSGASYCDSPALSIPDDDPAGVSTTFTITDSGTLSDVNIFLSVTHTWLGDLIFTVEHSGTSVTILDRPGYTGTGNGCSGNNINNPFDDEGTLNAETGCGTGDPAYPSGASLIPNEALSAFDGMDVSGDWTITVSDNAALDTGTLNEWCVQASTAGGVTPTISVSPSSISETHTVTPTITTQTLTISNTGDAPLDWTIYEEESGGGPAPAAADAARRGPTAPGKRAAVSVRAGDIVQDGSFEAGTPNPFWTEGSTNFGTPLCDATCGGPPAHSGSWYVWFGGTTSTETGFVRQDVTIPTGAAELRFWLLMGAGSGTGFMRVSVDGNQLFEVTQADVGTYGSWTEVTVDVSAYADGGSHQLSFDSTTQGGILNFFVDDVSITLGGGACDTAGDIPWAETVPSSGTTGAGSADDVLVVFNSAGLGTGVYTGTLCIESNDPQTPQVRVPLTLIVGMPTAVDLTTLGATANARGDLLGLLAGGLTLVTVGGFLLRRRQR